MNKLDRNIDRKLKHFEFMERIMKSHAQKEALITFRKNTLEKQNQINYKNELDRLTGLLSKTYLPENEKDRLNNRIKFLNNLQIK